MYASVEDKTEPSTSPITGLFNLPQEDMSIAGYIGSINDDDPRIATFIASQTKPGNQS